MDVQAVF